jgi:hypothetical protein
MFNIGSKKETVKRKRVGQQEQMVTQVKKILGQKDQGLIVMVRG